MKTVQANGKTSLLQLKYLNGLSLVALVAPLFCILLLFLKLFNDILFQIKMHAQ